MRALAPFFKINFADHNIEPSLWSEFDRLATFSPAVDTIETDTSYLLSFDLPGLKKEDLQIEVKDKYLIVSGERKTEYSEKTHAQGRFERSYGQFKRQFLLPETVSDDIQAKFENGVLELTLTKIPEASRTRKIEIQ